MDERWKNIIRFALFTGALRTSWKTKRPVVSQLRSVKSVINAKQTLATLWTSAKVCSFSCEAGQGRSKDEDALHQAPLWLNRFHFFRRGHPPQDLGFWSVSIGQAQACPDPHKFIFPRLESRLRMASRSTLKRRQNVLSKYYAFSWDNNLANEKNLPLGYFFVYQYYAFNRTRHKEKNEAVSDESWDAK